MERDDNFLIIWICYLLETFKNFLLSCILLIFDMVLYLSVPYNKGPIVNAILAQLIQDFMLLDFLPILEPESQEDIHCF